MSASGSFSIERVVTLLTPFFAAGASLLTAWLSTKIGVHVNSSDVEGVMAAAFLGTVLIVFKWLHGRQIPEIAGLTLSQKQVDQMHTAVASYLAAHAPEFKANEEQVGVAVEGYLSKNVPAAFKPDTDAVVNEVVAKLASGLGSPAPSVPPAS